MRAAACGVAARWRYDRGRVHDLPSGRLRGHELLAAVAEGTAGAVGDEFLRCLARNVAEAFAAKMVLVAEADDPSGMHVKVARLLVRRRLHRRAVRVRHRRHALRGHHRLPVGGVPRGAGERFPEAEIAINLGLQSYLAVCLRSSDDVHLGHLAVLDSRPMEADEEDAAALRIFAARASRGARAPQPGARAGGVARAGDRGGRQGAPPRRARPARRRAAAAARGLEPAARLAHEARRGRPRARRSWRRPRRSSRRRTRSCASSRAGCTRWRCASAGSARRWRRCARPPTCRSTSTSTRASCRCRSRAARTSWPPRRSPTPRATRRRAGSTCGSRRRARRSWSRCATTASAAPTLESGTGLLGLADRVDVLGGRLEVDSPRGGGTLVRATIPCLASSS